MFDNKLRGRIYISIPGKGEKAYNIAISELEYFALYYVPPEPPPFDNPYELMRWQERLKRSNEACERLGLTIARVFKESFQKDGLK